MAYLIPPAPGLPFGPSTAISQLGTGIGNILDVTGQSMQDYAQTKEEQKKRAAKKQIDTYLQSYRQMRDLVSPPTPSGAPTGASVLMGPPPMGAAPSPAPGGQPPSLASVFQGMPLSTDTLEALRNAIGEKGVNAVLFPRQANPTSGNIVYLNRANGDIYPTPPPKADPNVIPTSLPIASRVSSVIKRDQQMKSLQDRYDMTTAKQQKMARLGVEKKYAPHIKDVDTLINQLNTLTNNGQHIDPAAVKRILSTSKVIPQQVQAQLFGSFHNNQQDYKQLIDALQKHKKGVNDLMQSQINDAEAPFTIAKQRQIDRAIQALQQDRDNGSNAMTDEQIRQEAIDSVGGNDE